MFARHAICVGLLGLAAGCQFLPNNNTVAVALPPAPRPLGSSGALLFNEPTPATAPADAAAEAAAAKALAAKVASFTEDVSVPSRHHSAKSAAAAPTTFPSPDTNTILGNLLAPVSLTLSPYPQEQPTPRPRSTQADSVADGGAIKANAEAAVAPNYPLTIPEGSDHVTTDGAPPLSSDELDLRLAKRVKDYPKDLEGQLDYELLLFIKDQPVPQVATVSGMSAEDREVISAVANGLSNFRNVVRADNNLLLGKKIKPLLDMADRLRGQAELSMPTVALCKEVKSFGVYSPVESARFKAGRDNQVIVYCEVENFSSQLNTQNLWETKLTQETVLYTETGLPVWPAKSNAQPVTDVCRNRRHDFFIAKMVTLPRNLTIGRYLLKVSVTNAQANRVAEATTPVEIVAE